MRAIDFVHRLQVAGLFYLVTCTLRTGADQAALYAQGRTAPGRIVTWAKPGESLHEKGQALDVVPMRGGRCVWGTTGADLALWLQIGAMGEAAGLEWGGRWPAAKRDYPHFQYRG
jgi:peptidoglycan L-alanyl-D-glutamate endopeptidase CwlK